MLLKHKMKMSFFDASSALTSNNLIRYFSVSSHTPDNIMLLNLSIAKATSRLWNGDNYLFSLFQDTGINISTHDISLLYFGF